MDSRQRSTEEGINESRHGPASVPLVVVRLAARLVVAVPFTVSPIVALVLVCWPAGSVFAPVVAVRLSIPRAIAS